MDDVARQVGREYVEIRAARHWQALGNAGGFSGSQLWRIESAYGTFCLRAWPAGRTAADLQPVHRWMLQARLAGLTFVPAVLPAANGATCIATAGRCWELTTWQPGRGDFHRQPSASRLRSALVAVAQLHSAWQTGASPLAESAAVMRRHTILSTWENERLKPCKPAGRLLTDNMLEPLGGRAFRQLQRWLTPARLTIDQWTPKRMPLQPCLCDIWHDHVLFEGDRVTGIVDYGNMRSAECIAADLGRLLGSLVEDDAAAWTAGFEAYATVRPLGELERALAKLLDWTGVVVGVGHWLEWLGNDRLSSAYLPAATRRLERLVARMEAWNENTHGPGPVGIVSD